VHRTPPLTYLQAYKFCIQWNELLFPPSLHSISRDNPLGYIWPGNSASCVLLRQTVLRSSSFSIEMVMSNHQHPRVPVLNMVLSLLSEATPRELLLGSRALLCFFLRSPLKTEVESTPSHNLQICLYRANVWDNGKFYVPAWFYQNQAAQGAKGLKTV
jgi:hypothetical protein